MWLPRDERRMFVHYYKGLSSVDSRMPFFLKDLEKSLGEPNARGRAKIASKTLQQRNLIAFLDDRGDALRVQLALKGMISAENTRAGSTGAGCGSQSTRTIGYGSLSVSSVELLEHC